MLYLLCTIGSSDNPGTIRWDEMRCDWSAGNWDRGEPDCRVNRWVIICNLLPGFAWYGLHYGTVCQIIIDNASMASTIMLDGIVWDWVTMAYWRVNSISFISHQGWRPLPPSVRNDNRYCSRFQLIASLTEPVVVTRSGNPSKDNNLTRPIVVMFANI